MNQRLTAALLVGISIALIAAEILVATIGGFDTGWMLLLLSLYVGLVGLVFGLRTLSEGRRDVVESVSERRARAKREGLVGNLLDDYDVDEEFIGHGKRKFSSSKPAAPQPSAAPSSGGSGAPLGDEQLKSAVMAYADMVGGFNSLRTSIESMNDLDFYSMARKVGMPGVSRDRALAVVTELIAAEGGAESSDEPALSLSIDKESFDDYIKRCMNEGETDVVGDDKKDDGFSVSLDAGDLSSQPGTPPTEFSHDPKAVMERFKRSVKK